MERSVVAGREYHSGLPSRGLTPEQAKPPELLGKNEVGYVPYALIDRVIAVGREGEEAKDTSLQKQVTSLHDEVKRRLEGLKGRSV